jgi:hypothetical protein
MTLALPRRNLSSRRSYEGGRRRRVRVIADVRFSKNFPSPLLTLPDLGIHSGNLLPKIPVMRQEKNYKKM